MASIVQYVAKHAPRQSEIVEHIRNRIIAGELAAGARIPSQIELQSRYAVSPLTVQRAVAHLRDDGFVVSKLREGSYVAGNPPHLCRFGIIFDCDQSSPLWNQFYYSLTQESEAISEREPGPNGKRSLLQFHSTNNSAGIASHRQLVKDVEKERFAGLIFVGHLTNFLGTPVLDHPGLPRIGIISDRHEGVVHVQLDQMTLIEKSLRYLQARGRKRVAFISQAKLDADDQILLQQITDAAGRLDMTTHRYWVHAFNIRNRMWAAHCAEMLLHCGPERPDSLVITDDNFVPVITQHLAGIGVQAPDDIDLVAHCNFPYPTPSALPVRRIGFDAATILRKCILLIERRRQGESLPDHERFEACFDNEVEPECSWRTAAGGRWGGRKGAR